MDKYASQKKYIKKLVKLGIDVKPEIRERFRKCCEANNTLPNRVLRNFIMEYIEKNE